MLSRAHAFLDVRAEVALIEAALATSGTTMFRLCVLAGISPSTWVRWKQGKGARAASWRAVVEALRKVSPEIADKVDALNHPGAEAA